jgi:YHS domain-containing protein
MLKQFFEIIIMIAVVTFVTSAQDKPEKSNSEFDVNTVLKNEQPIDSTAGKTELVIWNKVCPVKGNPIEEDTPTVEYNGKLYGFCCPGCDTKFAKNPEKYAKNLNEDGTKFIGRK